VCLEARKEGYQKSFHYTKCKLNFLTQVKKVNEMCGAIPSILAVFNSNVTGTALSARNTPLLMLKCKLNYWKNE
jgi:hypothetical protein